MRGDQFHCYEDRRVGCQTHVGQDLASKVQLDGFLQVASTLVQRWPLGDDWNLEAFAGVAGLLPSSDDRLDCALKHCCLLPTATINRAKKYTYRHSSERKAGIARNALPQCWRGKLGLAKPAALMRSEEGVQ